MVAVPVLERPRDVLPRPGRQRPRAHRAPRPRRCDDPYPFGPAEPPRGQRGRPAGGATSAPRSTPWSASASRATAATGGRSRPWATSTACSSSCPRGRVWFPTRRRARRDGARGARARRARAVGARARRSGSPCGGGSLPPHGSTDVPRPGRRGRARRSARRPSPRASAAAATPACSQLANAMRGPVLTRGAAGYDAARLVYNERYDGLRPLAVARAANVADVRAAVRWSASTGVPLAARSGGHSYAGYSTTGSGVQLDLRGSRSVTLRRAERHGRRRRRRPAHRRLRRSWPRAGCTIPAGSCPNVGIGGLAQGGGHGLASRKLGLTCDDVQCADGGDRRRAAAHRRRAPRPRPVLGPAAAGAAASSASSPA